MELESSLVEARSHLFDDCIYVSSTTDVAEYDLRADLGLDEFLVVEAIPPVLLVFFGEEFLVIYIALTQLRIFE